MSDVGSQVRVLNVLRAPDRGGKSEEVKGGGTGGEGRRGEGGRLREER